MGISRELGKDCGSLRLLCDEKTKASQKVVLDFQAKGMPSCNNVWACQFSSTYFLEIYRGPRGNNAKIYESTWYVDDENHHFKNVELTDAQLCGCDESCPIEFKFINRNQYHMLNTEVAYLVTTLADLKRAHGGSLISCFSPAGKPLGAVKFNKVETHRIPSFSHYLQAGYQISLIGAIDFTFSNGAPSNPTSLHSVSGGANQYEAALRAVTDILDQYDSDKKYPFYGFGGIPEFMNWSHVSHCFPLNGDTACPEITGVDSVLRLYRENLNMIKLMGPTHFADVLRTAREQVEKSADAKMYHILMILTDGEVHDIEETIAEISKMAKANLPISIVIVGVGNEDFSNMVRLDGDDVAIAAGVKDIVQFVKYQDVVRRSEPAQVAGNLAALVLEEVPSSFVKCFMDKGRMPW